MAVITAIEVSSEHPGQVVIMADGRAVATIPSSLAQALGLRVGADFDAQGLSAPPTRAAQQTYERALRMLASRARSIDGLRRALLRKGEPAPEVEAALTRLVAAHLLDDAAFAEQQARARLVRGRSRTRVQLDLARQGVGRAVADATVARVAREEGVDEARLAEEAARRKLRALAGLAPEVRRRRLYAFLARQGYDAEAVRRALRTVLGEVPDDD
jgi:regulatory protein